MCWYRLEGRPGSNEGLSEAQSRVLNLITALKEILGQDFDFQDEYRALTAADDVLSSLLMI